MATGQPGLHENGILARVEASMGWDAPPKPGRGVASLRPAVAATVGCDVGDAPPRGEVGKDEASGGPALFRPHWDPRAKVRTAASVAQDLTVTGEVASRPGPGVDPLGYVQDRLVVHVPQGVRGRERRHDVADPPDVEGQGERLAPSDGHEPPPGQGLVAEP